MTAPSRSDKAAIIRTADTVFEHIDTLMNDLQSALGERTAAHASGAALQAVIKFIDMFEDARRDQLSGPLRNAMATVAESVHVNDILANLATASEQYRKAEERQDDLIDPIGRSFLACLDLINIAAGDRFLEMSKPLIHLNYALSDEAAGRGSELFKGAGASINSTGTISLQVYASVLVQYLIEKAWHDDGRRVTRGRIYVDVAAILDRAGFSKPPEGRRANPELRRETGTNSLTITDITVEGWHRKSQKPKNPAEASIEQRTRRLCVELINRANATTYGEALAELERFTEYWGSEIPDLPRHVPNTPPVGIQS